MMVVVADDFSGAAELAGIAWQYGFETVVQTHGEEIPPCEILIIDLNIRSKTIQATDKILHQLTDQLKNIASAFLYVKIDSVLRGHVAFIVETLIQKLGYQGALLLPANPSIGRIIKNGHYFIDEIPLNKTDFANDPEFPRLSSDLHSLLNEEGDHSLTLLKMNRKVLGKGIQLAECQSQTDLEGWTDQLRPGILPVGASDFFDQILKSKFAAIRPNYPKNNFQHQFPLLWLVGSVSQESIKNIEVPESWNVLLFFRICC